MNKENMNHLRQILTYLFFITFFNQTILAQSPYKSSWSTDGLLLGGSVINAFVASAIDDTSALTLPEVNKLSRSTVNWLDRSATYNFSSQISKNSDVIVGLTLIAPLTLLFDSDIQNDWGTFALMYLETISFATFIPSYGKGSVERIRPFVYNPDVPFDFKVSNDPKRSFFSGHTTWAFASAVFFANVYNDYHPGSNLKPYIWSGSLLLASTVGYLRYRSGAHFLTDVFTGALVGSAIGFMVPFLHRTKTSDISVIPSTLGSNIALSLSYKL